MGKNTLSVTMENHQTRVGTWSRRESPCSRNQRTACSGKTEKCRTPSRKTSQRNWRTGNPSETKKEKKIANIKPQGEPTKRKNKLLCEDGKKPNATLQDQPINLKRKQISKSFWLKAHRMVLWFHKRQWSSDGTSKIILSKFYKPLDITFSAIFSCNSICQKYKEKQNWNFSFRY